MPLMALEVSKAIPPKIIGQRVEDGSNDVNKIRIEITFTTDWDKDSKKAVKKIDSWSVVKNGTQIPLTKISTKLKPKNKAWLQGNFSDAQSITVAFQGGEAVEVKGLQTKSDDEDNKPKPKPKANWDLAKMKKLLVSVKKQAKMSGSYSLSHDISLSGYSYKFPQGQKDFWIQSLSLDLHSQGNIAANPNIENGIENEVALKVSPYYFVSDLIYQSSFYVATSFNTALDTVSDGIVDFNSRYFNANAKLEIPFTNVPFHSLHKSNGYTRLAMPLTVYGKFNFGGKDADDNDISDRIDLKFVYEMAFSPFLILKGQGEFYMFMDEQADGKKNYSYYSLTVAQDLSGLSQYIHFLEAVAGKSILAENKNFFFLKFTRGKKAPTFQRVDEIAFGFGTYL